MEVVALDLPTRKNPSSRGVRRKLQRIYRRLLGRYGPQGWWPTTTPGASSPKYYPGETSRPLHDSERWEVVVGAILTQNTGWSNAEEAIRTLCSSDALRPARMCRLSHSELARLIRPSRYYNQKARRLGELALYVVDRYGGSVSDFLSGGDLRDELLSLNGIGPETADSILLYAAQREAFVVDAYTRRICSRIGLVDEKVSYTDLQSLFANTLPADADIYNEYHALLVRHAVERCRTRPICSECCLRRMCDHARATAA